MREAKRGLAGVVALLAVAVLASGAGAAPSGDTSCTGTLGAVTITGNLNAGPGCTLNGTTITGKVTVLPGGSLDSTGAIIGKDVESHQATSVRLFNGSIGGNVKIDGTTGANNGVSEVAFATVKGNVEIKNSAAYLAVAATVGGNVQVHDNKASDSSGQDGIIFIVQGSVHGNIEVHDNQLTGTDSNLVLISNDPSSNGGPTGGNLQVHKNVVSGGTYENVVEITRNTVMGNLEVHDNAASGLSGSLVYNDVSANNVSKNLDCHGNKPPASDAIAGANTAKQKKGECASL